MSSPLTPPTPPVHHLLLTHYSLFIFLFLSVFSPPAEPGRPPHFSCSPAPISLSTALSTFLVPLHDFLSSPASVFPLTSHSSPLCSPAVGPGLESLMFASSLCYGFWIQHIWIPGPRCVVATATSVPLVNMGAHPPQSREQNNCVTFFVMR